MSKLGGGGQTAVGLAILGGAIVAGFLIWSPGLDAPDAPLQPQQAALSAAAPAAPAETAAASDAVTSSVGGDQAASVPGPDAAPAAPDPEEEAASPAVSEAPATSSETAALATDTAEPSPEPAATEQESAEAAPDPTEPALTAEETPPAGAPVETPAEPEHSTDSPAASTEETAARDDPADASGRAPEAAAVTEAAPDPAPEPEETPAAAPSNEASATADPVPQGDPPGDPETAAQTPVEVAMADPAPAPEAAPEEEPAPETQRADPDAPENMQAPVFDIVRIDQAGSALVAGRAAPDETVEIIRDGAVIDTATAGPDGAFLAMFRVDPDARAQEIAIRPVEGGGAGERETPPLVVLNDEAGDSAPVVVQPAETGIRLVQPAAAPAARSVTLDAISYDEAGRVVFAGRGSTGAAVRLYLDGARIVEAALADDASWRAQADKRLAPGVYTLRVDEIDDAGAVVSRVETPFQREEIAIGVIGDNKLVVQRGNNLWRLAERYYGEGERYTVIYQANADVIRDPDLIYPGQVFTIPDEAAEN